MASMSVMCRIAWYSSKMPLPPNRSRASDHLAGLERVVHLGQCGDRVGEFSLLLEATDTQAVQLHRGDLGQHLDQLVLVQLEAHQGLAELGALLGVAQRRLS